MYLPISSGHFIWQSMASEMNILCTVTQISLFCDCILYGRFSYDIFQISLEISIPYPLCFLEIHILHYPFQFGFLLLLTKHRSKSPWRRKVFMGLIIKKSPGKRSEQDLLAGTEAEIVVECGLLP